MLVCVCVCDSRHLRYLLCLSRQVILISRCCYLVECCGLISWMGCAGLKLVYFLVEFVILRLTYRCG